MSMIFLVDENIFFFLLKWMKILKFDDMGKPTFNPVLVSMDYSWAADQQSAAVPYTICRPKEKYTHSNCQGCR